MKQCKEGIFISQSKYINELLKKYKIDQVKQARIPMATNEKLDLDRERKVVSENFYGWMIESLLHQLVAILISCLVYIYVLYLNLLSKNLASYL